MPIRILEASISTSRYGGAVQTQNPTDMEKDILTTAQAGRLLGVSIRTAQLLIEAGSLTSWKTPGGHRRVRRADVMALMSGTNQAPAFSSALLILVASPERLARYRGILMGVDECSIDGYSDAHSASFAIGSRLPAAVIIDLEESSAERLSLLRSLILNPALGHTRIIAIGDRDAAAVESQGERYKFDVATYVESLELLPDAVRAVLRDASEPAVLIEGTPSFPLAANEAQRLSAVDRSGLVDTAPEESFDRLTWLAGHSLEMPIALLTMITPTRQWFKSRYGLEVPDTPRSWAFCNYTILQRGVFAVENLVLDARFADNPAVAGGPEFRFYAGVPVIDSDGFALGSLCVIDHKPRKLDQDQMQSLIALAALASDEVRLRATDRRLRWALEALNRNQRRGAIGG